MTIPAGDQTLEAMRADENPAVSPAALKGYALIGLVCAAAMVLSAEGPVAVILGGAVISAVVMHAILTLNPAVVALEVILLTLLGHLALPSAPTYWMMGSAVGGAVAAGLARRAAEEDDHFFLPPLATGLATFLLFALGQEGGWAASLAVIGDYVASYTSAFDAMLALPENQDIYEEFTAMEQWESIHQRIGLIGACLLIALWTLVMWLFNRVARWRLGRTDNLISSLLLFRVRAGYTFLLIAALIFEIVAVWREREALHMIAYPLFAVCAVAFLMVYVGVVMFFVAIRRAAAGPVRSIGLTLFLIGALALAFYVGWIVGLADVWIDFRKVRVIRERFS